MGSVKNDRRLSKIYKPVAKEAFQRSALSDIRISDLSTGSLHFPPNHPISYLYHHPAFLPLMRAGSAMLVVVIAYTEDGRDPYATARARASVCGPPRADALATREAPPGSP